MRGLHDEELSQLTVQLTELGELVCNAIRMATGALLDADLALAQQVIHNDGRIDRASADCEEDAQRLLVLPAPVSGDLRAVLTPVLVAERLERMGDLAVHIAEAVQRRHPRHVVPPVLRPRFAEMGRIAVSLAMTAAAAIATGTVTAVNTVRDTDDEMNDLHRTLFSVVCYGDWDYGVTSAVDVSMLSRCYERFADHAVSVVDYVTYATTGERPGQDSVPAQRYA
jgi:phosphate transport system protein